MGRASLIPASCPSRVEAFTGFETANSYDVFNAETGEAIYTCDGPFPRDLVLTALFACR